MSITYTPTTNFGSKDSLPSNDPNKVIKGAEFTTEFTAIQSAFGLAAPTSNPTFTGTATFDSVTANAVSLGDVTTSNLTVSGSFTSVGIDDNATSTAITIDANENVGIGTSDPILGKLQIDDASPFVVAKSTTTAGAGYAMFVNGGNNGVGVISTDDGGHLTFDTGANGGVQSEKMRIDASGNVKIATDGQDTTTSKTLQWGGTFNRADITVTNVSTYAADMHFSTGNNANYQKRMTITNLGKVGIGTTSPDAAIHATEDASGLTARFTNASNQTLDIGTVSGTGAAGSVYLDNPNSGNMEFRIGGSQQMRLDASGNLNLGDDSWYAAAANRRHLHVKGGSSGSFMALSTSGSGDSYLECDNSGRLNVWNRAAGDMVFGTNNVERMRITPEGNVGIGTNNPINSPNYSTLDLRSTVGGQIVLGRTGTLDGYLYTQDGLVTLAASAGNALAFLANSPGGGQGEAMRIDTTGNLLVGRNAAAAVNVPSAALYADGSVYSSVASANSYHLYNTGAGAYKFYVTSDGYIHAGSSTITVLSDERLKENIRDLDDGLDKIMALQPRKFNWKEGKGRNHADDRGFIAQELEVVFPDMVNDGGLNLDENGESYKTITPDLVPTLVKAMQEQQALIEALTAKVEALENA